MKPLIRSFTCISEAEFVRYCHTLQHTAENYMGWSLLLGLERACLLLTLYILRLVSSHVIDLCQTRYCRSFRGSAKIKLFRLFEKIQPGSWGIQLGAVRLSRLAIASLFLWTVCSSSPGHFALQGNCVRNFWNLYKRVTAEATWAFGNLQQLNTWAFGELQKFNSCNSLEPV